MTAPTDLADRYGAPSTWRRRVLIGGCALVVAAFLGWLGWTAWAHATPEVDSELVGYEVIGEHASEARVDVRLADDDVAAVCTLRAYAEDHTVVGELSFVPDQGRTVHTVRTERRATSVELLGCIAPGQSRPR